MPWPNILTAPVANTYLHNDTFPGRSSPGRGAHRLLRIQGRHADHWPRPMWSWPWGPAWAPSARCPSTGSDYWPERPRSFRWTSNARVLGLTRRVDVASPADVKEFARELMPVDPNPEARSEGSHENGCRRSIGKRKGLGRRTRKLVFLNLPADASPPVSMGTGSGHSGRFHRHHRYRQQFLHVQCLSQVQPMSASTWRP